MIEQYLSIKEKYKDAILFYRMGDFYEMFFEDAQIASKILEITLTSRNKKDAAAVPMCGIPVRAIDNYIGRLINKGHKVAICEQVEDPAAAKGLVKRDVVRVITPGMIVDNALLDEKTNNYILAITSNRGTLGLSYLDISTGLFRISESDQPHALLDESIRISPSEILFPEFFRDDPELERMVAAFSEKSTSFLPDKAFEARSGREMLIEQFNTRSLEGFGCEGAEPGIGAAGALLSYVRETQKQNTEHIRRIEWYSLDEFLMIDDISCRNLELMANLRTGSRQGTLLAVIDRCVTAMGSRLLKQWIRYPLIEPKQIQSRLSTVKEVKQHNDIRHLVRDHLKSVYDLERLSSKITMGQSNARDLVALKNSIQAFPEIFSCLAELTSDLIRMDGDSAPQMIEDLYALAQLIESAIREDAPPTINEGGIIKSGYNKELDDLTDINRDGKGWLAKLETDEKQNTGISSLKVKYNKVFGYYIEVPKSHSKNVPPNYVRKQTLVNAERYITDELKTYEITVLNAQEKMADIEFRLFNEIRNKIIECSGHLLQVAGFIARLDCLFNLAEIAAQNNYSKPDINTEGIIQITDGRHPVVEKMITGERFVPNTIRLDDTESQILIITGPNMAGKSTILRQVAILVLMAQMGSFVPAASASISVTDRIFTRVGALDNLSSGQSTFMVEMEETANIMNNAGSKSLVIMDEIGRGTSTFDGLSIAWAVADYLHDLCGTGVKTLFATHYHELTDLAQIKDKIKNYNIAVKEWNDEIIFLRKLVEGSTNRSYGIQVARLAGIPGKVIGHAKKVLSEIENREHGSRIPMIQDEDRPKGQTQLNLFRKPEEIIIENLQTLDLSMMTPLDALNYLNQLKEKAGNISY